VLASHGLHPRRAIDVNDCRHLVQPFRGDALGKQHEWRVFVALEYLIGAFGENDRGEGPERLPVLDPRIEHVFH